MGRRYYYKGWRKCINFNEIKKEFNMFIIGILIGIIVGFISGALVGRRNKSGVEKLVNQAKDLQNKN